MSAEENKAIMRQYFEEVFNKGNQAFAAEHIGAGYVVHRSDHGSAAPSDFSIQGHTTVEDQVAEGDKVVSRCRFEGTVTGEWKVPWGTFTTVGKPMTFTWLSIDRFENGKIVEAWVEGDFLGIAMQVGATPKTKATA
jgi:predicted ester cyclase